MVNSENDIYKSPFCSRYSSKEMLYIFSEEKKIKTWRKLWVALSKAEKELGLPISSDQIKELEDNINIIDYETAKKREKIVKHDVMAQIYAYGKQCENASKIIHLGATSCYVTDNADIIIMKEGLKLIKRKLLGVIKLLSDFSFKNKNTLSFIHTFTTSTINNRWKKGSSLDTRFLYGFCRPFKCNKKFNAFRV